MKFYNSYDNKPPKVLTVLDTDTVFVSQSDAKVASLDYQLHRYGMDSLQARFESMKEKFGYADCTKCNDFAELQNKYRAGVEYFEALPSEIRRQFGDKPENFYESIQQNPKLAYEHGFISEEQFKAFDKSVIKSDTLSSQNIQDNSEKVTVEPTTTDK